MRRLLPPLRAIGPDAAVLASLYRALTEERDLVWAVEHAGAGDPVPRAWAGCVDSFEMMGVLSLVSHPRWKAAFDAVNNRPDSTCYDGASEHRCAECANAIRAAIPTLTLAECVAYRRAATRVKPSP